MPVLSTVGAMTYVKGARTREIPFIGTFIFGGFFAGVSAQTSTTYTFLIVANYLAPGAAGFNTFNNARNSCLALVLNGYSDWDLPTRTELGIMCSTKTQFAAIGQGYNTIPNSASSVYWTRTKYLNFNTFYWSRLFWNCAENDAADYDFLSFRAVRTQVVSIF